MRILGIDPGSTVTGFGVVEHREGKLRHLAHGTVRPPRTAPLAVRLAHIYAALAEVVTLHEPDLAVVEQVFVAVSPRSALVLGQARGVALASAAAAGVPVEEVSPREIKQAVVGTGTAAKAQVQDMVRRLLDLTTAPAQDAADALAAAICRAHRGRLAGVLEEAGPRRRRGRSRAKSGGFVLRRSR